jgi:hypothetical protein
MQQEEVEIGQRAEAIIERLSAINYEQQPSLDKKRAEAAINAHLEGLGHEPRPVVWIEDARARARALARASARARALAEWWWWDFEVYNEVAYAAEIAAAGDFFNGQDLELEKALGTWLPFVDAYEAGLLLFWAFDDETIALPRPAMIVRDGDEQLHCESGPAVWWPNGEAYYFLNGVKVTREIVETPASELDPQMLLKETNAEVRRELLRKIGIERVCRDLHAAVIDTDDIFIPAYHGPAWDDDVGAEVIHHTEAQTLHYELLLLDLGDGRRRPYLKMFNPSVEGLIHIEGVAPHITTVREALNWRNGLTPEMIDDEKGATWFQQGDVILRPRSEKRFKSMPVVLA